MIHLRFRFARINVHPRISGVLEIGQNMEEMGIDPAGKIKKWRRITCNVTGMMTSLQGRYDGVAKVRSLTNIVTIHVYVLQ